MNTTICLVIAGLCYFYAAVLIGRILAGKDGRK